MPITAPLPSYTVVLKDDEDTTHRVTVTGESVSEQGDMRALAVEIARMGRKNLASRGLDYDSYRSDSQYADDLDRIASGYVLVELLKDGERTSFTVDAYYGDRSGPWTESLDAVDADEAEFQAAWRMNLNCAQTPTDPDFLESLADHTIHHAAPTPVSTEELAEAVGGLIARYRQGGTIDPEIAQLAAMIGKLGMLPGTDAPAALASTA